jgi:hypothetical protein
VYYRITVCGENRERGWRWDACEQLARHTPQHAKKATLCKASPTVDTVNREISVDGEATVSPAASKHRRRDTTNDAQGTTRSGPLRT